MMRRHARAGLALLAGLLVLAGCAGDRPKPVDLQPLTPQIAGRQVWSSQIGSIGFALQIAARPNQVLAASDRGDVVSLDPASGQVQWRTSVGANLSAGVGSDGRFAAVVTQDNELVVLDGSEQRWRAPLGSRVVTTPFVAGERVFVLGVDRSVQAFDAVNGRLLWTYKRPGDALLLAQPGVLAAWNDSLLVGIGARLVSLDPVKGIVRSEVAVATPRGTNEVERLADLVGPVARSGSQFCARAFQNAVGCVDAKSSTLNWSHQTGGVQAVGGSAEVLVAADGADRITARRRADGTMMWSSDLLLYRRLSAPTVVGPTVVLGDLEGWVHFLSLDTGAALLRLPTDGSRIVSPPVNVGNTLIVATENGGIFGFRPE